MHLKGQTICTHCGKVVRTAPGFCMICGETFPMILPFVMSDYSSDIQRVAVVLRIAA